jgi:hypothetical protein
MQTEADIYTTLNEKSHVPASLWPGATLTPVKGTRFSSIKFSDDSQLYITTGTTQPIQPQSLAKEFFLLFSNDVMSWLQATPVESWPPKLRDAYAKASGSDPFAAEIWDELATAKQKGG